MLKGKATIQLFDGDKVVQEIHEENMITNAIDTILNPPDYVELGMAAASENSRAYNMLQLFKGNLADTAFHGVICCRDKIDENVDRMMLPWDNEEVGHAGMSTTSSDSTVGTYNENESGIIENGKGYRHVWDFGTDKSNGEISCICLTTKDGGTNGYHNTFWELSAGGCDLNSSSTGSFQQNIHAIVGRYINDKNFNCSHYKWFYMSRLDNGNIRLLGKNTSDCAIYEVQIYNPTAISIRQDKPFCDVVSVSKVIEVFPAPTVIPETSGTTLYFHGDSFIDSSQSNASYLPEEDKERLRQAWEADPPWLCYFPYVKGNEIHVIGTSRKHIHHYIYDLNTYVQKSKNIIETDVDLQPYDVGFHYEYISNRNPQYRWFYGIAANSDRANTLGAFLWDDMYFAAPANPLIDGERNKGINNYHQLEVFSQSGKTSEKTFQYYSNSYLNSLSYAWREFYVDEKTNTPIAVCDGNNTYYILAVMLRKTTKGYGYYRMRISVPTYSSSNYLHYYANLIKIDGMTFPLYAVQNYPDSNSDRHYFGIAFGVLKNCLTSINNLSQKVRKLDGQAMKITYDIVEEDEV